MSYTFTQTGSEIQAILDRAEAGGQIDQDIAAKQDQLTFDDAPTSGSDNPVKSGGIYDAIQAGGAAALAAFATDSVSGDVVSITDGADSIPVKAFTGSILPQQNLNGQSAPYPAGGGKNKIDADTAYSSYKTAANNYQTTASNFNAINITIPDSLVGTACTFSAYLSPNASTSNFRVQVQTGGSTYDGNAIAGGSSGYSSVTFTPASGFSIAKLTYGSGGGQTATVKDVQLETGSSRTAWTPYANICPISGWTGANIYRTGVNVWDEDWEAGGINASTGENQSQTNRIRAKNLIPIKPSTSYYVKAPAYLGVIAYYGVNGQFLRATESNPNAVITTPSDAFFMRFVCGNATTPVTTYGNNISINYPSTATTYQPYNGSTIVLSFGQTVYAGTLTALGGGMWSVQPTHERVLLSSLSLSKTADGIFASALQGRAKGQGVYPFISDTYKQYTGGHSTSSNIASLVAANGDGIYVNAGSGSFYIADHRYTDANTFKQDMGSVVFVYELATYPAPITITGEDLQTLLGANTVWTDVGAITGMTYRADTALYIQKLLNGGGTLSLSMASPSPSLSLGRVGVLAEPEEAEPEQTEEEAEQTEQAEEE